MISYNKTLLRLGPRASADKIQRRIFTRYARPLPSQWIYKPLTVIERNVFVCGTAAHASVGSPISSEIHWLTKLKWKDFFCLSLSSVPAGNRKTPKGKAHNEHILRAMIINRWHLLHKFSPHSPQKLHCSAFNYRSCSQAPSFNINEKCSHSAVLSSVLLLCWQVQLSWQFLWQRSRNPAPSWARQTFVRRQHSSAQPVTSFSLKEKKSLPLQFTQS